jgi:phenol hydroxylase P1 protein
MQIDIKTSGIQPIRQTFSHVARRLGADKPASRYQEATLELQPEVNFHYRPIWQPELEIYDKRRTAIQMADWYAFRDPRQYYYGAYTIARSRQQDTMERNLDFVSRRGLLSSLSQESKDAIAALMIPLRHVEWAANTNNCYVTAYGWGTAITQATMYHGMDRLGIAQYLSRVGLLLDENLGTSLVRGKQQWLESPRWQPMRRTVEQMFVVRDWFETFVAQNLVLDGLLYPLVYRHIDAALSDAHGPGLSMLNEFSIAWFDETGRWVDATIKTAAAESEQNAQLLAGWVEKWSPIVLDALAPIAELGLGKEQAGTALNEIFGDFSQRLEKIGLTVGSPAQQSASEVSHG